MILQHKKADDFVVATEEYYSIEEFLLLVFKKVGLNIDTYVAYDKRLERPNEVKALLGDASKIRTTLGWKPECSFQDLVGEMLDNAMEKAYQELVLKKENN